MKTLKRLSLTILLLIAILVIVYQVYFYFSDCGIRPLGCGDYPTDEQISYTKIVTGEGPEDMAIDTSHGVSRLIISCSPRRGQKESGGFYSLRIGTNEATLMTIVPDGQPVYPHGIHITIIDSITWLYAISHEPQADGQIDKIIRYQIQNDSLIMDMDHVLMDPLLKIPNDLHVLSDGTIYVTNYLKNGDFQESLLTSLGKKTGDVIHYDQNGQWSVVIDDLCYPNGIYVDEDTDQLILANGACQEVLKYDIIQNGQIESSSVQSTRQYDVDIPMGDNLVIDQKGALWTTNHPCTLDFVGHASDTTKKSASQVRKIDPKTLSSEIVWQNNGDIISAASTAIYMDGHLYVSQVFDPFIIDIKMD